VNMRRVARTALAAPLLIGGGMLALTVGTATVFAASSATPQSSSKPHEHEFVTCSPDPIDAGQPCTITFTDPITKAEPFTKHHKVCFSVKPSPSAGTVSTTTGTCTLETKVGTNGIATGTYSSSPNFCGPGPQTATIYATEPSEHNQKHHTTVTVLCETGTAPTSAFIASAGSSSPPSALWLLGALGLGAALVAVYAMRIRRWLAPRRVAARQPE
jgi:hypothetical protein